MLEETLSSPTYSPAEAALTLISFVEVELAAGGPLAEARFFQLFSMLCDRVFGVISEDENSNYRHQTGGWLSRHVRWERPRQTNDKSMAHLHPNHPRRQQADYSVSTDPVVKLLGARTSTTITTTTATTPDSHQAAALTLIQAMAKEAEHRPNVRYPFPFKALPKSTQQAWLALLERAILEEVNTTNHHHHHHPAFHSMAASTPAPTTPMMMNPGAAPTTPSTPSHTSKKDNAVSENAERLLGSLFRVKPREQHQLRTFLQTSRQEKSRTPNGRPLQLSPIFNNSNNNILRSPAAVPKEKETQTASNPKIMLSMLEYYLVLFLRYPIASPEIPEENNNAKGPNGPTIPTVVTSSRRSEPYGDSVYYQLFQEYTNYYLPVRNPQGHSNTGFDALGRPTELFLRLCLAFWLESSQVDTTSNSVQYLKQRRGILDPDFVWELSHMYDLVKAANYSAPPFQVQRCFHKLVARAVSDGALADVVRDTTVGLRGAHAESCLSPTLHMMQVPFYNYVRTSFRHASIHARQSPFYTALNDWLLWLEPWNTTYGMYASN